MHSAILSLLDGEPDTDTLDSTLDGFPAADMDATAYLDGRRIHHGTLAGRITKETRVPVIGDEAIWDAQEDVERRVYGDAYIDLTERWAGISTAKIDRLLEGYCLSQAGVTPVAAELDLQGFAEQLPDGVETNGIVYSQSIDEGHARDAAGADWHQDASPEAIPNDGLSALAVRYTWDGSLVDAMLAASGYVAVYREWAPSTFARWVADEIVPYLSGEDDEAQAILDRASATCDRCGREPEHELTDEGLCIVCDDAASEGRA